MRYGFRQGEPPGEPVFPAGTSRAAGTRRRASETDSKHCSGGENTEYVGRYAA